MIFSSALTLSFVTFAFAKAAGKESQRPNVICNRGPRGAKGATGWQGPAGLMGPPGANGIDGRDGVSNTTSAFINVYTDVAYPEIAVNAAIPVDTIQAVSAATDFTFNSATGEVTVINDGVYSVTFNVAAYNATVNQPASVGLYNGVNGFAECQYWTEKMKYYIIGQCLVPLSAGSVVTLRNLSEDPIGLWPTDVLNFPLIGVKASLIIYKVYNNLTYTTVIDV